MATKNTGKYPKEEKKYIDLLYLTPSLVTAKDIAQLLCDDKEITVQLWDEMNVLELELPNQNSVDFEPLTPSFQDPSDAAFLKNRNIKTIFAINLCDTDLNYVNAFFDKLVERHSGFVCADTVDFTPVYAGSSKKQ